MPEVFVAAGSNIRPRANLRQAIAALSAAFPGLRSSRAYANKALGFEGDDFINLVLAFQTEEPLPALLQRLRAVERASGREPGAPKWAARTLDLDLLMYGNLVGQSAGAALPRPDLTGRSYVLGPLAELAPELRHPVLGDTFGELWRRFDRGVHPLVEVSLEAPD